MNYAADFAVRSIGKAGSSKFLINFGENFLVK